MSNIFQFLVGFWTYLSHKLCWNNFSSKSYKICRLSSRYRENLFGQYKVSTIYHRIAITYILITIGLIYNSRNLFFFRWFIIFCISTCLLVLMMAIHKSVSYCVKKFKHDQDNGEDIGAKFLLCCLDSEFSSLDKMIMFL